MAIKQFVAPTWSVYQSQISIQSHDIWCN